MWILIETESKCMELMARDLRHPYKIPSTTVLGDTEIFRMDGVGPVPSLSSTTVLGDQVSDATYFRRLT